MHIIANEILEGRFKLELKKKELAMMPQKSSGVWLKVWIY